MATKGNPVVVSGDVLRELLETSERLWNGGDRDGFLALWKEAVPGEYTLETPVGTEPRRGWDQCRRAVWDDFQPLTRMHTRRVIVCRSEAAAVVENVISTPEGTMTTVSIDTYVFLDDGGCVERNYFDGLPLPVPPRDL